jgi:HEPN domain-containing protein
MYQIRTNHPPRYAAVNSAHNSDEDERRRFIINVALRCFRDNADREYAHARLAYKALLGNQFLWSALHCLEKYAKGAALLREVSSKHLRHEVIGVLRTIQLHKPDQAIHLSSNVMDFIEELEKTGARERYLGISYTVFPEDLEKLDLAVFEIREFCFPVLSPQDRLTWEEMVSNGTVPTTQPRPYSGWLEKVVNTPSHSAFEAVAWNNSQLGTSLPRREDASFGNWLYERSPLSLGTPKFIDELANLIFIDKSFKEACLREMATDHSEKGTFQNS